MEVQPRICGRRRDLRIGRLIIEYSRETTSEPTKVFTSIFGAALLGQPLLEERPQQCGQGIAFPHGRASVMRRGAPSARNRSLASCNSSCVTVM